MKVSKGQSQPEIVSAAFKLIYMILGRPLEYLVLIVTHLEVSQHDRGSKPMGSHFGVGDRCTTHFRTYFSGWIGMFTGRTGF